MIRKLLLGALTLAVVGWFVWRMVFAWLASPPSDNDWSK